ncbi:hypothetical protein Bca52824_091987 [Brassica carinata]|uniref:F-box domain-containing protein n=1 Tax=Brassica carinata TaxID=52824 RepID=A0A8X7NTF5_BRACI|nr:hypothetical protein Bca52824_091987 [Brassica carinata]
MGDSISSLPDEILGKILSLVPTKVAASTSVLSKRWRNLLSLVDRLSFDESMVVYPNEEEAKNGSQRFSDFVDKTLALLHNSPAIKTFSLCRVVNTKSYDDESARVSRWISTAMEHGLLELHLYAPTTGSNVVIESRLLRSNTLVKLTITGHYDFHETHHVFLPSLRSLYLMVFALDLYRFEQILHACPVLEELTIRRGDFPYMPAISFGTLVEHASIKRLVIVTDHPDHADYYLSSDYFDTALDTVRFQAPSLVYLDYSSFVSKEYDVDDLDSLVEARLSLKLWMSTSCYDFDDVYYYDYHGYLYDDDEPSPPIFGDVTCLVAAIRNITTLHLSPDSLEVFHFCCTSMPMFNNLLTLSIESNKQKGWQVMPLLLECCPNLQTIVIKGLVHKVTNRCGDACACNPQNPSQKKRKKIKENQKVCCLRTCGVKVLEISDYGGRFQELQQMRYFLGNLERLETVKVLVDPDKNSEFVRANVMALPRLSSKCTIQFI